jgi:hypothetical protein
LRHIAQAHTIHALPSRPSFPHFVAIIGKYQAHLSFFRQYHALLQKGIEHWTRISTVWGS